MAVFSFHPVKHITTGEGGLITTNSKDFYKRLIVLRTHGITKEETDLLYHEGGWYHEMQMLGYNYRLTDIQCALGLSQMRRLDAFIKRRKEIAQSYYDAFEHFPHFSMIHDSHDAKSSFHLFPILLSNAHKAHRRLIFDQMRKNKLGIQVHYIPVYWHPYYHKLGYTKGMCPKAEDFYSREISIPMYPSMSNDDVEFVINTIKKIFQEL